jgi:intraflagellar transport protein 122
VQRQPPLGVSVASVVYLLAKQSVELGAYKLARFAYNKLQTLVLPPAWQEEVDLQSVIIRSKPISDKDELLPVCYRCSTTNPLLNPQVCACTCSAVLGCWLKPTSPGWCACELGSCFW